MWPPVWEVISRLTHASIPKCSTEFQLPTAALKTSQEDLWLTWSIKGNKASCLQGFCPSCSSVQRRNRDLLSPPHYSTRMLPAEISPHHLTHSLVREAHQHQRSGECMPTINRNYDTQVSTEVGGARAVDARQSATETAPIRPADTWHQTGKCTKTALQGHH